MFTKKLYKKFVKSLMELNNVLKKRMEELCSESKLSIDEAIYLFTTYFRLLPKILQLL